MVNTKNSGIYPDEMSENMKFSILLYLSLSDSVSYRIMWQSGPCSMLVTKSVKACNVSHNLQKERLERERREKERVNGA